MSALRTLRRKLWADQARRMREDSDFKAAQAEHALLGAAGSTPPAAMYPRQRPPGEPNRNVMVSIETFLGETVHAFAYHPTKKRAYPASLFAAVDTA